MTKNTGKFITLEGIEGAGKSTMLNFISEQLQQAGNEVVVTREPGGTRVGEKLQEILLDNSNTRLSDDAELLIIFAARAQHLQQVIRPALNAGQYVLCDRFTDASYAYQGGGRNMSTERIRQLEDWVQQGLEPDLTILFDLDVATGLRRAGKRGDADRFEQEHVDFFERIRQCYIDRASAEPERFRVIDAASTVDNVKQQILEVLKDKQLC
ncbi:MAG: dTMP kinase [Gammaproteobacteria bacterium]